MGRIIARCLGSMAAASALLLLPPSRRDRETAPRPAPPAFWVRESPRLEVVVAAPSGPGAPLEVTVRNLGQERTLRVTGTLRLGGETRRFRAADLWAGEETSRRFPAPAGAAGSGTGGSKASGGSGAAGDASGLSWDLSWSSPSGRRGREEGAVRLAGRPAEPPAS